MELVAGDEVLASAEDPGERLSQQVRTVERTVGVLHEGELAALDARQLLGVLLEHEACASKGLDAALSALMVLGDQRAAYLVERVVREALNVESIRRRLNGLRCMRLDRLDVRLRHVQRHDAQLGAALGPKLREECAERLRVLALAGPDDLAGLVVGHDRHVLVVFAIAQLVDADDAQPVQPLVWSKQPTDDALDDAADGGPGDPHQSGNSRLVHTLREVGGLVFEGPREHRARFGPRQKLRPYTTARAIAGAASRSADALACRRGPSAARAERAGGRTAFERGSRTPSSAPVAWWARHRPRARRLRIRSLALVRASFQERSTVPSSVAWRVPRPPLVSPPEGTPGLAMRLKSGPADGLVPLAAPCFSSHFPRPTHATRAHSCVRRARNLFAPHRVGQSRTSPYGSW